jgi:hypothetical protein
MLKMTKCLTRVLALATFALVAAGCQPGPKTQNEKGKVLDVQVDVGNTKVKVEGTAKPDEHGRHLDVNVEHKDDGGDVPKK